jgi:hypothetical protein
MSLDWNLKRCDQKACWNSRGEMTSRAHGLIWGTMAVGLHEITEKNLTEWCWRLNFELRVHGDGAVVRKGMGLLWDEADLRPFIGLHTNATVLTRKQYVARCGRILSDEIDREETRRLREARTEGGAA